MDKGKLIMLFVSFAVVFGGWFGVKGMLNKKIETFLERKDIVDEITSELAVQKNNKDTKNMQETDSEEDFVGVFISEEQIANVLAVWGIGGPMQLHEPKKGQINMDQAIVAGENWICSVSRGGIFPDLSPESKLEHTKAILCTIEREVSFDESLLSCWYITYKQGNIDFNLVIHAASGQVWRADITVKNSIMYDHTDNTDSDKFDTLALVFPFITFEQGKNEVVDIDNNILYKDSSKGTVRAAMYKREAFMDNEEQIFKIALWLETVLFAYSINEMDLVRMEEYTSINDVVQFFPNQQTDADIVMDWAR